MLLRLLLKSRATVNAKDYDARTALHISAAEGNLSATKVLIEIGNANVNCVDRWGRSPLDDASRGNFVNVVDLLVKHGGQSKISKTLGEWKKRGNDD